MGRGEWHKGDQGAGGPGGDEFLPSKLLSTRVAINSLTNKIFVTLNAIGFECLRNTLLMMRLLNVI